MALLHFMNPIAQSRDFLIGLAYRAIRRGLVSGEVGAPDLSGCPTAALAYRACFVTLTTAGEELRGCRGTLEARRPLAADVWHNAWASAFDDPRFAPVTAGQFGDLGMEISVIGPLEALPASTEDELRRALVPERDGVVLAWRGRRATFLPQVWENLPDPREFLAQLKLKAGLPADFWAPDIQIQRYSVEKLRGGSDQVVPAATAPVF
jgi:AmmeMemoRadiSam system protein A